MAGPTDTPQDEPPPDPQQWQRKHRPEPASDDKSSSDGGNWGLLKVLLGAIATIVLSVVGFVRALDSGRPVAAPQYQNAEGLNLKQLLDRQQPDVVLQEVGERITKLERTMAPLLRVNDWGDERRDRVDGMFGDLCLLLDQWESRLTNLDPARLSAEQLQERDTLLERIDALYCFAASITGPGE